MEMRLIENKGKFITQFKFSKKNELNSEPYLLIRAVAKEIYKENTRYVYLRINGDFLNGRQLGGKANE